MTEGKIPDDLFKISDNAGIQQWIKWSPAKVTALVDPSSTWIASASWASGSTNPHTIPAGGTMAIPQAQPATPAEVAKVLRGQVRAMLDYLDTPATQASADGNYIASAKSYLKATGDLHDLIMTDLHVAMDHAKLRQAAPGMERLRLVRHNVELQNRDRRRAVEALKFAGGSSDSSDQVLVSRTTWEAMKQMMEVIHRNVQALPASNGLPTDMAENTLRAIGVVMQNAGYVAKKDEPDGIPVDMLYAEPNPDDDPEEEEEM